MEGRYRDGVLRSRDAAYTLICLLNILSETNSKNLLILASPTNRLFQLDGSKSRRRAGGYVLNTYVEPQEW